MNKILVAGLIVAVASTGSFAQCGNGGFYIGLNAGVAFTKMKTKTAGETVAVGGKYLGESIYVSGTDDDDSELAANVTKVSGAIADEAKGSKKKGKFLAELVLGYDFRVNDVMMGVDLTFGSQFGKNKKTGNTYEWNTAPAAKDKTTYAELKQQWHIGVMPRIGYLFTPEFEGYLTAGVKFARYKFKTINGAHEGATEAENLFATEKPELYNKPVSKAKMKVQPVVGAGIRYEITPELFTKLEYNFEFKTKAKLPATALPELKKAEVNAHVIKLGLGYRF